MTTAHSAANESATSRPLTVPLFAVISGGQALQGREKQIVELVEAT